MSFRLVQQTQLLLLLTRALPVLLGCTNETAQNYNPWATLDNGSCEVLECDSLETLVSATVQDTCHATHMGVVRPRESFNYDKLSYYITTIALAAITVMIEDDGGDGWGNSKLGMVQGDQQWLFTMGPGPV